MSKLINLEFIEHTEEDIKDFEMENECTTILEVDRFVFSVNHNKDEKVDAQEALREQVQAYILALAKELKEL